MPPDSELTPMLRQYLEIKEQHKDAILFYRIGDFYEMFFDDAIKASKVLDIVLTSRNKNDPNPVPLCGVPYHSVQPYLEKLVEKGFKVAICDQVEDPKAAKGVVRRDVTRVVTPGVAGTLVSLHQGKDCWGLAVLEVSTGDFRVTEIEGGIDLLREEVGRIGSSEVVVAENWDNELLNFGTSICLTKLPSWIWDESYARKILYDQFGVSTLSGFDCEGIPEGVVAAGVLLHYVRETQKVSSLLHITSLKRYERGEAVRLGEETVKNLSLEELIQHVDRTKTAMGRRLLREWFFAPLIHREKIQRRLDAVSEMIGRSPLVERMREDLDPVYDLEKINSRLSLGTANARDLRALCSSLEALDRLKPAVSEFSSPLMHECREGWDAFPDLQGEIARTLVDDPPLALSEGGLVREGVSSELDGLKKIRGDAKGAIAAIEEREKKRTGIGSLKVRFNQVFGYYLEVPAAQSAKVPADYTRKQTLANAERFITPELKEFEDKVLGADEKVKALEYEIFSTLRARALQSVPDLQAQAGRVALVDVLASLAVYSRESRGVRPTIEESGILEIKGGRHPLVEAHLPSGRFVPNDLLMDVEGQRLLIVTGPNMAGKSTVIRQTGVIVLMAQAGCFVPAESARIGIVDQIFTRVGAGDRLARGESTFMVEMCETASILHHATEKSLILLDEIGRGTSTFDGISIAWAVAEHLYDKVRARTLFATHYHELIDLALTRPGIKNYNVQVKEEGGEVVFLYRLVPGGMSHSYGIHVAKLAGLPPEVVERSREVLKNLEQGEMEAEGKPRLGKRRRKDDGDQGRLF